MRLLLVSGVLCLSLVFAGCTGGSGGPSSTLSASNVAAPNEFVDGAGRIVGFVIDDENQPLEAVDVALLELSLQVSTNPAGAFEFQNIPPGKYRLVAQKLGYDSGARAVEIQPGEAKDITLILAPIAIASPYQETVGPFTGYFECRMGWPGVPGVLGGYTGNCGNNRVVGPVSGDVSKTLYPNDKSSLRFNLTADHIASVIGEMTWAPSAYGTSPKLQFTFSYDKREGTHWWCSGSGSSPARFDYHLEGESRCASKGSSEKEPVPTKKLGLLMWANAPFGDDESPAYLTLQQDFTIMGTLFYGDPAPEGFSGLPDA